MIGPLYCRNNQNPRRFEVGLMLMKGSLKLHDFDSKTGFKTLINDQTFSPNIVLPMLNLDENIFTQKCALETNV